MNKKERLLDFVLFVLSDFEELLNEVSWFFSQAISHEQKLKEKLNDGTFIYEYIVKRNSNHLSDNEIRVTEILTKEELPTVELTSISIEDYWDYIDGQLEPMPKSLFKNENFTDDFQSIRELISKKEEFVLIKYLNENFRYRLKIGVDKETKGFSKRKQIYIDSIELNNYFEKYQKFKNVNHKVYISFFVQLLKGIEETSKKSLKREFEKIKRYKVQFHQIEPKLSDEFKSFLEEKYKKNLFESIINNKVQIAGFFQNFENEEVFVSFDETLVNQLSVLPEDFDDYSLNFKLDSSISHLSLQYLNYSYFAITPEISEENKTEREARQLELDEIKKNNSSLISFLNEKGFTNGDINILINLLHQNKFSTLNIGHIRFTRKVMQFHVLYAFYILDFYEEKLDSKNDFEVLISDLTSFDIKSAEQYRKYYKNCTFGKYPKHFPFTQYDRTISKIASTLNINREKLKDIPNKNLTHHNFLI